MAGESVANQSRSIVPRILSGIALFALGFAAGHYFA